MRIELRSDTFTKPTKEMLDYMFNAEVGDDVWEEDYTAKALAEITDEQSTAIIILFIIRHSFVNKDQHQYIVDSVTELRETSQ